MSDGTAIEWTDATWNPITGCSVISAGCTNCYAMRLAGGRLRHHPTRAGLTRASAAGPVWTGEVRFNERALLDPARWMRPRRIFVCAHGDLFHEAVPDAWIDSVFAVMGASPQHTFQVLTKRAARMQRYMTQPGVEQRWRRRAVDLLFPVERERTWPLDDCNSARWPDISPVALPNVWLGVSVESQDAAQERLPWLLETPAAVCWISAEPLLEQVALDQEWLEAINWVVAGGESGPGARPMHLDWARSLRDQCRAFEVPFFFKQWGAWQSVYDRDKDDPDWRRDAAVERDHPGGRWLNVAGGHGFHGDRVHYIVPAGKAKAGRLLDGREWNEYPKGPRERFELQPR